jgi:hypothetical protein
MMAVMPLPEPITRDELLERIESSVNAALESETSPEVLIGDRRELEIARIAYLAALKAIREERATYYQYEIDYQAVSVDVIDEQIELLSAPLTAEP